MNSRGFDPLKLEVAVLAKEGAHLEGRWPLPEFLRLVDFAHRESMPVPADAVAWSAQGELRRVRAGDPQVWLHLTASTRMSLVCQRCLQPVEQGIDAHRSFRFVLGEEVAAELDADCEDDVLALPRVLDLRGLVEDELLLSLPLVPRHEQCALPLPLEVRENPTDEVSPHPFAALAALKGRGSLGQG